MSGISRARGRRRRVDCNSVRNGTVCWDRRRAVGAPPLKAKPPPGGEQGLLYKSRVGFGGLGGPRLLVPNEVMRDLAFARGTADYLLAMPGCPGRRGLPILKVSSSASAFSANSALISASAV